MTEGTSFGGGHPLLTCGRILILQIMEENATTKVYCGDRDRGSDALAYAAMANRGNDPMALAAMMNGGMNGWQNNPFIYLVWMMFAQRMWGNGDGSLQNTAIQGQLDSLRTQMSDNHNSDLLMSAINGNAQDLKTLAANLNCDFNQLQTAVCSVRSAIDQVAGGILRGEGHQRGQRWQLLRHPGHQGLLLPDTAEHHPDGLREPARAEGHSGKNPERPRLR